MKGAPNKIRTLRRRDERERGRDGEREKKATIQPSDLALESQNRRAERIEEEEVNRNIVREKKDRKEGNVGKGRKERRRKG